MNATGRGFGSILAIGVAADGSRSARDVFRFRALTGQFVAAPIDLGAEGEQMLLSLFGTGMRGRRDAGRLRALVGGNPVPVLGFAPSAEFLGLDQVNSGPQPRDSIGSGEVKVRLVVEGTLSNIVTVEIQ